MYNPVCTLVGLSVSLIEREVYEESEKGAQQPEAADPAGERPTQDPDGEDGRVESVGAGDAVARDEDWRFVPSAEKGHHGADRCGRAGMVQEGWTALSDEDQ
jgi:hypothetical protein